MYGPFKNKGLVVVKKWNKVAEGRGGIIFCSMIIVLKSKQLFYSTAFLGAPQRFLRYTLLPFIAYLLFPVGKK